MKDWRKYLFSLAVLILCASLFVTFLRFHEDRVEIIGWRFEDPLFPFLPRQNLSLLIFTCTHSSFGSICCEEHNVASNVCWKRVNLC
jgi:hypothetical protein